MVRVGFASAAAVLDGDLEATELLGELGALLERELLGGPAEDGALPGLDLRAWVVAWALGGGRGADDGEGDGVVNAGDSVVVHDVFLSSVGAEAPGD